MAKTEDAILIPQERLVPAPENVRTAKPQAGTADLEASILARGLLQNLIVYPEMDGRKKSGNYAVAGGERRRRSIRNLVERAALSAGFPVRCLVRTRDEAVALSLAENAIRENMTPVDQFRAFSRLIDSEGMTVADVAAQYAVPELVVRQRLKLAALSPRILAEVEAGRLNMEQAKALCLAEDHTVQERAWFDAPPYYRDVHSLRDRVSSDFVRPTDPRVVLVTLDAYKAAGGHVVADLFDDTRSFLADVALLDELAGARLDAIAAEVRAEGWKWVEVHHTHHFDRTAYLRHYPAAPVLNEADAARLELLVTELNSLVPDDPDEPAPWDLDDEDEFDGESFDELDEGMLEEGSDEPGDDVAPDEVSDAVVIEGEIIEAEAADAVAPVDLARVAEIRAEIQRLTFPAYTDEVMATCGAAVTLATIHEAKPYRIERGLMRLEDIPKPEATTDSEPAAASEAADATARKSKPLSATLLASLTAHKTAALRVEVARSPRVALRATAHKLAVTHLYPQIRYLGSKSCLNLSYTEDYLRIHDETVKTAPATLAFEAEIEAWRARVPSNIDEFWDWLMAADDPTVLGVLAVAVAASVTAVEGRHSGTVIRAHVGQLALALQFDMANWWEATPENYFDRVSKTQIGEAVTEGVSAEAAENIAGLKKAAMATLAADRLKGRRWLPEILRTPIVAPAEMAPEDGRDELRDDAEVATLILAEAAE